MTPGRAVQPYTAGHRVVFSLGGNLGDRSAALQAMRSALSDLLGSPLHCSPVMETEPLEMEAGTPWFYNQVVAGEWCGTPQELLVQSRHIECLLGRTHKNGRHNRTADIDILFFGKLEISTPDLVIPHPAVRTRRFILEGLLALDSDWTDPVSQERARNWWTAMDAATRRQIVRVVGERA